MTITTGNFSTDQLLDHEQECRLSSFDIESAIEIGRYGLQLGCERDIPIVISIRIGAWEVFKASLPGSTPENDGWIERKANVVNLKHHSTLYERVLAEESGIDWHRENLVDDATHAIHGGGFPLITKDGNFHGALVISGLPQVEDHLLAREILTYFA